MGLTSHNTRIRRYQNLTLGLVSNSEQIPLGKLPPQMFERKHPLLVYFMPPS